jgi:predicted ferric reductase
VNAVIGVAGGGRLKSALLQGLVIVLLSIPGVTWISITGDLTAYWRYEVPAGQVIYLLSKLAGLYAFVTFWLQLMYGLLGAQGRARLGVERGNAFHRQLGAVVVVLMVAHIVLFVAGVSIRTNHFASQYLTPTFSEGYYRSVITLGILAASLVVIGVASALARRALRSGWKFGHWLLLVAYGLVFVHSILIGSESRISPVSGMYVAMAALALGALIWRLAAASGNHRRFVG